MKAFAGYCATFIKNKIVLTVVTLVSSAVIFLFLVYQGILRFNYPSMERFPVQGIDVSHHQGNIEWNKLKSPQAQFVYIKASEGVGFKDARFTLNWKRAFAAGVVPGAYHYFSLCKPGAQQAMNFITAAAWSKSDGLPPAIDLEFGGNCSRRPSLETFRIELQDFINHVENEWGCPALLYVTRDFYDNYALATWNTRSLWVRDIYKQPHLEAGKPWKFWQFANRDRLPGINTFVDRNVFNGKAEEFSAYRCKRLAHLSSGEEI